jgi:hypothetical protein
MSSYNVTVINSVGKPFTFDINSPRMTLARKELGIELDHLLNR